MSTLLALATFVDATSRIGSTLCVLSAKVAEESNVVIFAMHYGWHFHLDFQGAMTLSITTLSITALT
jgi:hypothetical protein